MTKLDKNVKQELEARHRSDYENGRWGAAVSTPYRVKKWLSKGLSDRLLAAAHAEWDAAKAAFDSIPASKRMTGWHTLRPELDKWGFHGGPALPVEVEGHGVHVAFISYVRCRNGHYKAVICARDVNCYRFTMPCNRDGYPSYGTTMRYMVYWDDEQQRFYAYEWLRASTGPVPDGQRRRNWARKGKEREFLAECAKLQKKLLEEDVLVFGLKDVSRYSTKEYVVDCFAQAEVPDPQAAEPAPGPSGSAPAEPAPAQAAPASGVTVCFTGPLSITRLEAANLAKAAGMGVASSVGRGTTYLVTNTPDSGSSKNRKARELGVALLNEAEFRAMAEMMTEG